MSYRSPSQDNDERSLVGNENKDIEGQCRQSKVVEIVSKTTSVGSQKKKSTSVVFQKIKSKFVAWLDSFFRWKWYEEILVLFRATAVSLDPFFLYVPLIKEDKKCIELNKVLWTFAIVSRSVTDVVYLVHFVGKSYKKRGSKANTECRENGRNNESSTARWATVRRHFWSIMFNGRNNESNTARWATVLRHFWSIVFNVLVILPIPQVVMPSIFSVMRRTKSSKITILNSVILLQYGPRVFQINQYRKALKRAEISNKATGFTASLNLFLYILAGHVLGAFWYFFSTQRLAACWHKACEIHSDGIEISFNCDHSFRNLSFLDDFCPIDPPNPKTFDFGIFLEARRSGSLESTGFLQKGFYCFWWGMRNLSSLGSNLQTSSYIWENIFALGISIFGLLLFLYFIGNLEMYMERRAKEQEKAAKEQERAPTEQERAAKEQERAAKEQERATKEQERAAKEQERAAKEQERATKEQEKGRTARMRTRGKRQHNLNLWMSKYGFDSTTKRSIKDYIDKSYEADEDVYVETLIPDLPTELRRAVIRHICLNPLKSLKIIKDRGLARHEQLLLKICHSLKPMFYNEHCYIVREGEPIDAVFFITDGIGWTYTSNNGEGSDSRHAERLGKGQYFGGELLEWFLRPTSIDMCNLSKLPVSSKTLKTETKVEAFALMAHDLKQIWHSKLSRLGPEESESNAALLIQRIWRRNHPKMDGSDSIGGGSRKL